MDTIATNFDTHSASGPALHLQSEILALLPLRPVLLRQHPQLHLHLAGSWICASLRRMLLSLARLSRYGCPALEKFPRLP